MTFVFFWIYTFLKVEAKGKRLNVRSQMIKLSLSKDLWLPRLRLTEESRFLDSSGIITGSFAALFSGF